MWNCRIHISMWTWLMISIAWPAGLKIKGFHWRYEIWSADNKNPTVTLNTIPDATLPDYHTVVQKYEKNFFNKIDAALLIFIDLTKTMPKLSTKRFRAFLNRMLYKSNILCLSTSYKLFIVKMVSFLCGSNDIVFFLYEIRSLL